MTAQNVFQIILIIVFAMLAFVVIFPRSEPGGAPRSVGWFRCCCCSPASSWWFSRTG